MTMEKKPISEEAARCLDDIIRSLRTHWGADDTTVAALIEARSQSVVQRPAKEEKKPGWKPWTQETCPFPCMVRHVNSEYSWQSIGEIHPCGVSLTGGGFVTFKKLAEHWEHRSWHNGHIWAWLPCRREL